MYLVLHSFASCRAVPYRLHLLTRCCTVCTLKRYFYSLIFFSFLFFFSVSVRVSLFLSLARKCLLSSHIIIAIVVVILVSFAMKSWERRKTFSPAIYLWRLVFFFFFLFFLSFTNVGKWLRATINMGNGIGFRVTHKYMKLQLTYDKI